MNALVVDDDKTLRETVALLLLMEKIRAIPVASGLDAVERLRRPHAFDFVLSDVQMPGPVDGWRLLAWVRRWQPNLPVLLMTGDCDPAFVPRAQAGGARGALRKPFLRKDLRDLIETLFDDVGHVLPDTFLVSAPRVVACAPGRR